VNKEERSIKMRNVKKLISLTLRDKDFAP